MHGSINFKSPNNTRKWQMGFNSAFEGLITSQENIVIPAIGILLMNKDSNQGGRVMQNCL
jgi:hypothetical protein